MSTGVPKSIIVSIDSISRMIILACYSLMISHPGPIFARPDATKGDIESKMVAGNENGAIEFREETGDIAITREEAKILT